MSSPRSLELAYFWRMSSALHEALRIGDLEAADEAYDELACVRYSAISPEVERRCGVLIDARVDVPELTREPFVEDWCELA